MPLVTILWVEMWDKMDELWVRLWRRVGNGEFRAEFRLCGMNFELISDCVVLISDCVC
jgi:hypothetical protein